MKFVKQIFTEDISIDDDEFIDCTFTNCVVWFHGSAFSLVDAKFDNVRFGYALVHPEFGLQYYFAEYNFDFAYQQGCQWR